MDLGNLASNAMSMLGGMAVDALFGGGQLQKASLVLVSEDKKGSLSFDELTFPINPESVTFTDKAAPNRSENLGSGAPQKQGGAKMPRTISFTCVFYTYEARKDVREEYIKKLSKIARPDPELHINPTVHFCWGKLSAEDDVMFAADLEDFEVTYTMFLPDGTPVRCTVKLTLTEVEDPNEHAKLFQSPDHAKLHTVKRGDTLQNIAFREYDNANEWRRIADANGIDDPMNLEPGTRLLVPPILK